MSIRTPPRQRMPWNKGSTAAQDQAETEALQGTCRDIKVHHRLRTLYMLQTRTGKRCPAPHNVKVACEHGEERLIDEDRDRAHPHAGV